MKPVHNLLVVAILGAAALGYVGASARGATAVTRGGVSASPKRSAEEARKDQLLRENTGMGAEPALADEYDRLNATYFSGRLATVPVRWEERLSEIGPMIADGFRLEGLTNGSLILLNTSLAHDAGELRRALCHEM